MADIVALRGYQREAVDAVQKAHKEGMRRPAVVLSTGAGKTVVFSHLIAEHLERERSRAIVLVHRDELADQAIDKIRATAPHLSVGKVKAEANEVYADVMVCSVQTLSRGKRLFRTVDAASPEGRGVGLIVTDECHHAAAASYRTIYNAFPDALHAGFTATLARGDGVGLGSVWDEVVYTRPLLRMIADGYLTDVRGITVDLDLDLKAVRRSGGDFAAGSLGEALETADGPGLIARAVAEHAADRRCVVFTPTVAVAVAVAAELTGRGMPAAVVSAATPREERAEVYRRSRTGELHSIVNCQVLTEGFDAPWIDCVVVARPTQSAPLFVQMVGRGLRPFPGKADCLLVDVAGTGGRLATLIDLAPGEVPDVRPGETLAEAADRETERRESRTAAGSRAFALKHRDMDLFRAASQNWLRTPGGVLFIPVAQSFLFLWPSADGKWDVGGAPPAGKWQRLRTGLPLGTAQAWAETFAAERSSGGINMFSGVRDTSTEARWRRSQPTPQMLARARSAGLSVPDGTTQGEVSDWIAIRAASRLFDNRVKETA